MGLKIGDSGINKKGVTKAEMDAAIAAAGGGSGASYLHTQAAPSSSWNVNHNLGFKPDVATYSVGGLEFVAEVLHISDNQLTITLAAPTAGFARCT